jgi:hypothetical protein
MRAHFLIPQQILNNLVLDCLFFHSWILIGQMLSPQREWFHFRVQTSWIPEATQGQMVVAINKAINMLGLNSSRDF